MWHRTTYLACTWLVVALPSAAWAKSARVQVQAAALRTAPFLGAPLSTVLERYDKVAVDEATNGWRRGRLPDGKVGYVQDADLEVVDEPPSVGGARQRPVEARPLRLTCPWIFRPELTAGGEGGWWIFPSSENTVGRVAATLGRNVTERLSAELTVGTDFPNSRFPGVTTMAVGRAAVLLEEEGSSALTFAAGPLLIAGGAYGPVVFGHAELGYEYRGSELTFLLSAGPDLTFNDSARQSTAGCGAAFFGPPTPPCVRPFNRGDIFLHIRLGMGFAFGG